MSVRAFLQKCFLQFFIISAFVNLATAAIGPVIQPNLQLEFNAFYSPLLVGLLGTLPSVILYSRKELNFKQTIIRKAFHLFTLEVVLVAAACVTKSISGPFENFLFTVTVFIVYLVVHLVIWLLENRTAKDINARLKALREQE